MTWMTTGNGRISLKVVADPFTNEMGYYILEDNVEIMRTHSEADVKDIFMEL